MSVPATEQGHVEVSTDTFVANEFAHAPRMGPYEFAERLGGGGFGSVYRAIDTRTGATVAVKVPRWERPENPRLQRHLERLFLEEGRRTQQLSHPHIVQVHEVGEDPTTGMPFIAMEWFPQGTLTRWMSSDASPSLDAILQVVEDAARGVAHAHRQNIFHLDLKPANILLTNRLRAKVADFGIALHENDLTRNGGNAGTLPYMSPEQLKGALHVDGRSDIWSLGIILYELLAKRRPFVGNAEQLRSAIREKSARPLLQRGLKIPAEVDDICRRCLEKQPDDRFSTADELAKAIRAARRRPKRRVMLASGVAFLGLAGFTMGNRPRSGDELLESVVDPYVPTELPLDGLSGIKKLTWAYQAFPPPVLAYDSQRHSVTVKAIHFTLLQLARTECGNMLLETTLRKTPAKSSWAGLFLGYRPLASDNPTHLQFQTLVAKHVSRLDGNVLRLERTLMQLQWQEPPDFKVIFPHPVPLRHMELPAPIPTELHLQLEFRGGFLHSLRCNGQACPQLENYRELDVAAPPMLGGFGFLNYYGEWEFRDTQATISFV